MPQYPSETPPGQTPGAGSVDTTRAGHTADVHDSGGGENTSAAQASRRVIVRDVLTARYRPGTKPLSWDKRFPGIEQIVTSSGEKIALFSGGGQSSPEPGWELLLLGKAAAVDLAHVSNPSGELPNVPVTWTLYGIRRGEAHV